MTNQQELDRRQEEIAFYEALVAHAKKAVDKAVDDRDRFVTLVVVLLAQARLKKLRGE